MWPCAKPGVGPCRRVRTRRGCAWSCAALRRRPGTSIRHEPSASLPRWYPPVAYHDAVARRSSATRDAWRACVVRLQVLHWVNNFFVIAARACETKRVVRVVGNHRHGAHDVGAQRVTAEMLDLVAFNDEHVTKLHAKYGGAVNQSELIESDAAAADLDERTAEAAVDAFIAAVMANTKAGNRAALFGLGSFASTSRAA